MTGKWITRRTLDDGKICLYGKDTTASSSMRLAGKCDLLAIKLEKTKNLAGKRGQTLQLCKNAVNNTREIFHLKTPVREKLRECERKHTYMARRDSSLLV
jgi:hypothetical protein